MKKFKLTYARTVVLTREILAESEEKACDIAADLEEAGVLGLEYSQAGGIECLTVNLNSVYENEYDEDSIWEIEEIG